MAYSAKGSFVVNEKFWIVAIILMMLFTLAVWLLLNQSFVKYVSENIISDVKICDTFQNNPIFGSVSGCDEGAVPAGATQPSAPSES